MNEALLNSQPRLHAGVGVHPQVYRGDPWYLLQDESSGEQLLADQQTWQLLELIRRGSTLIEATRLMNDEGYAVEETDALGLVATLARADMLDADLKVPIEGLLEKQHKNRRQAWQRWLTPFSLKVPLLDPAKLLARLAWVPSMVFSTPGLLALALLGLYTLYLLGQDWNALSAHWQSRFIDPANLATLLLLYPLVKGIHELGHGLAARHWGAEIHEMGLMFLVFMPVPYVDASRTTAFYSARHRMVVAGAGIAVELILSALALVAWHNLPPGLGRDLCFNVAIIGGISTLMFNGNPLLRFDGYYVFADAVQIPNLATRSQRYLGYCIQRWLLRLQVIKPAARPDEQKWLLGYALASGIYRLLIGVTIVLYVAGQFLTLGLLLAIWFVLYQILRPFILRVAATLKTAMAQEVLPRTCVYLMFWLLTLPLMLFTIPVPHHSIAHGILLPPESSLLRAPVGAFVQQVSSGTKVAADEQLLILDNPDLAFQQQLLAAKLDELEGHFGSALMGNRGEAANLKSRINETQRQWQELEADRASLTINSATAGRFSVAGRHIAPGRYVEKGDLLGYVSPGDGWIIQALVSEDALPFILADTRNILVVPKSNPTRVSTGAPVGEVPQAVSVLPVRMLGSLSGGPIPVDATDPAGTRLLQPMFQLQVKLPEADYNIGQTFILRFEHQAVAPGRRWARWILTKIEQITHK